MRAIVPLTKNWVAWPVCYLGSTNWGCAVTEPTTSETPRNREPLPVHVRKARPVDVPAIKSAIARAFDDDPFVNWMVMQDARRARRIYDLMALALDSQFARGEVYTTDDIAGAAVWTPPGKSAVGFLAQFKTAPRFASAVTWKRMPTVIAAFQQIEKKHPKDPHFYLGVLGVDTEFQGRGVGTKLMQPVLDMCDRDRIPAYLESSKEKNVPLYERNGFKVTEVLTVPKGGPPLWLMFRDPQ